ncbi:glycosyltransferase family 2 protein [Flavobacterium sp. N3904]|uniref:glycosyltransferase family 2 protein n=1 Tax=Flavobacterium sp. N3904 TaxID=2986835 RepID=UPI0022241454|nr:glycosyltransferase family A protein [Flavobacterium sp. N3904]
MLVSIIIPVHQTHDYFKSCVESALAQTYTNLEIIVACNGELTLQQCQNFLNIADTRLVFIKTSKGRHSARNEALKVTKGSWIQFLDYDDYLFPYKIEEQLISIVKSIGTGLSICQWKKFTERIDEHYTFPFQDLYNESQISAGQLVQKLGQSGGFIATASWLVSKELLTGSRWIDSPNDDAVFLSEILKKSPEIIMSPKVLAGYRIHDSNTSSIRSKEEFDKLMHSWRIIHQNLLIFKETQINLYLYKAYLNLIRYSKQINKYRIIEVIYNCLNFGFKARVGFLMYKDFKRYLLK